MRRTLPPHCFATNTAPANALGFDFGELAQVGGQTDTAFPRGVHERCLDVIVEADGNGMTHGSPPIDRIVAMWIRGGERRER